MNIFGNWIVKLDWDSILLGVKILLPSKFIARLFNIQIQIIKKTKANQLTVMIGWLYYFCYIVSFDKTSPDYFGRIQSCFLFYNWKEFLIGLIVSYSDFQGYNLFLVKESLFPNIDIYSYQLRIKLLKGLFLLFKLYCHRHILSQSQLP